MKYAHAGEFLKFFAKCQDFGIGFAWGGLEEDDYFLHGEGCIVAALGGQIEHFAEQILGSPIVLENLHKVGGLADVVGDG